MVITESWLRARKVGGQNRKLALSEHDIITQAALDYIREQNIDIAFSAEEPLFFDAEGRSYADKPEHMTHLHDNLLVPKTNRRIAFRGKLDTLQSKLLEAQIIAERHGLSGLVDDLEDVLSYVRAILACEVKETPFERETLLGMTAAQVRGVSHHPHGGHHVPGHTMGEVAVWLNSSRALAREAELAAAKAFVGPEGEVERGDLLLALNRLSSALYVLLCIHRRPPPEEVTEA